MDEHTIADDVLERIPMNDEKTESLSDHQKEVLRTSLIETARKLIGIPYYFGAEWTDYSKPPLYLDCSEMTEGIYHINGLRCPDGAQNQFNAFLPTGSPHPGDLAFFGKGGKTNEVYHVGMVLNESSIIEARGHQPEASFETGKVIIRPIAIWVKYPSFIGFRAHSKLI